MIGGRGPGAGPPPPSARDGRSDELKAAAIVGVVCIHAGVPFSAALRFGVPVFVAVWAFQYERGLARRGGAGAWGYAARRLGRLVPPYLAWTALYLAIFRGPADWRSTPARTIVGGWLGGYGWAGQYFLVLLMQLTPLFPLVRRAVTPASTAAAVVAGVLLDGAADYALFRDPVVSGVHDRLFVYWLPYVFLGVAFARGYPPRSAAALPGAAALLAAPAELARLSAAVPRASAYLAPSVAVGSVALLLAAGPRHPAPPARGRWPSTIAARAARGLGARSFDVYVGHLLFLEAARRAGLAAGGPAAAALVAAGAVAGSLLLGSALRRAGLGLVVGA